MLTPTQDKNLLASIVRIYFSFSNYLNKFFPFSGSGHFCQLQLYKSKFPAVPTNGCQLNLNVALPASPPSSLNVHCILQQQQQSSPLFVVLTIYKLYNSFALLHPNHCSPHSPPPSIAKFPFGKRFNNLCVIH